MLVNIEPNLRVTLALQVFISPITKSNVGNLCLFIIYMNTAEQ